MRTRGIAIASSIALASTLHASVARADDPPPLSPPDVQPAPPPVQPAQPTDPNIVVEPSEPLPPPVRPAPPPYEPTVVPYEPGPKPIVRRTMLGLDTHIWSAERSGTGMPMVMFFAAALGDSAAIDVRMPMAFGFDSGTAGRSAAAVGNPTVTVLYAPSSGGWTWFIGGRLAAPLSSAGESAEFGAALTYGLFATAYYDLHHWIPNHVPFGFRTGLEYQYERNFFFRASWDPTFYFPFGRRSGADTVFVHQMRMEVEGRSDGGFGGGLGLQYVHVATERSGFASGDALQTAVEPYFAYESKSAFFMRAGWLVALDEPLGFGFDRSRVASFRLTIGSQL